MIEAVRPGLGQVASPYVPFEHAGAPVEAESDLRAAIVSLLGPSPVAVDEIVRQSGGAPGAVQLILLELDLAGDSIAMRGARSVSAEPQPLARMISHS